MKAHGYDPSRAAIVVSSIGEPTSITGAHARAHAEEETLYRDVMVDTLATIGLDVKVHLDATLRAAVAKQLDPADIDAMLKRLAREVGTPWRAPEKHASLAAWLALPR
jgi:hypothetical protein